MGSTSLHGGEQLGLSVLARTPSDRTVYPLLGRPHDTLKDSDDWGDGDSEYDVSRAIYIGAQYDASTTNLTYHILNDEDAAPAEIVLSFVSPITPTSTMRQSIPASYLTVYVSSTFDIDVYVDVNGQWVSGDRNSQVTWAYKLVDVDGQNDLKSFVVRRDEEKLFEETEDMAEWGALHFTGPADAVHNCGPSYELRQRFATSGSLQDACEGKSRGILDSEPAFAFAKSFNFSASGGVSKTKQTNSITFTIAHIQDSIVQFASARGLTHMRPLWKSYFSTPQDLLTFHYFDRTNVLRLANEYSEKLLQDADAYLGPDYADVLALSARQVMGATSFSGTPSNPILFLKEISSNGNCQTVDIIFPASPFFLYTNPRWLAYLLEPLLEHQLSGQYPNKYSMHDLGTHFPNMTGHADGKDEYMPLEESGDMTIMALALVQSLKYAEAEKAGSPWAASGLTPDTSFNDDGNSGIFALPLGTMDDRWGGAERGAKQAEKWLGRIYELLKQWASYLVEFSLEPHNQLSTDDFAGWLALHSNLALKGIVGIRAMSELANILGYDGDAKYYHNISETYANKWQEYAVANDGTHVKLAYNWQGSWTTLYSLYSDSLLCFHANRVNDDHGNDGIDSRLGEQQPLFVDKESDKAEDLIPDEIYKKQSDFYSLILQRYGLPLDSRHLYAKSDWMFEAAAVAAPELEREIMGRHAKWVNNTKIDRPLSDLYETEDEDGSWGGGVRFLARAVVGGHWAGLALERACGGNTGRRR